MHDSKLEDPIDYSAWIGRCGVCLTWFECKDKSLTNPAPHGTFCPVCRGNGLIAPGVVHLKEEEAKDDF